jgi:hypothetical protein
MKAPATIIADFHTNISQSLYVQPTMDVTKAKSFIDAVNPALGAGLAVNDVLVLFDERKGQGLAITSSHLVVNIGMAGMFSLDSLESVNVPKVKLGLHRRLTIRLASDHTLSFVLTKGNRGAEEIGAILERCIRTV